MSDPSPAMEPLQRLDPSQSYAARLDASARWHAALAQVMRAAADVERTESSGVAELIEDARERLHDDYSHLLAAHDIALEVGLDHWPDHAEFFRRAVGWSPV